MGVRFRPRVPPHSTAPADHLVVPGLFLRGFELSRPRGHHLIRRQNAEGPAWMRDEQPMALEFRRYAAMCVAMAERMSVVENRNRMMEMAERFLQRAQKEDVKAE